MRWAVLIASLLAAGLVAPTGARAQPSPRPPSRVRPPEPAPPPPERPALGWRGELIGPSARHQLEAEDPIARLAAVARLARHGDPTASVAALVARLEPESDARVRHAILDALARRGDRSAVGPIADAITDWGREDRAAGLRTLGALGGERATRTLVDWLATADVGDDAVTALARIGPAAVPHLVGVLDVPISAPRAAAALGRIGDTRGTFPLVSRLRGAVPGARLAMIRALGAIGDERATPALLRALTDADPWTVAAALAALARVAGPDEAPLVAGLADRGTSEQRAAALETLATLDPAAAASRVEAALGDAESSPLVRAAALEVLLARPSEALLPILVARLHEPAHRLAVAEALSRVERGAGARPLLAAAIEDGARALDPALALAVRRHEDELPAGVIAEARRHLRADPGPRGLVLAALARDERVARRIVRGLAHEDPAHRAYAAQAAGLLASRGRAVSEALGAQLVVETDPAAFRAQVLAALRLGVSIDPDAIDGRFWDTGTIPEALWLAAANPERTGRRGRRRARRAMRRALRAGQPRVRAGAAIALALAGDRAAHRALVAALDDDHDAVRLAVARALEVLAVPEAAPAIAAAARVERDDRVRRALLDASLAADRRPPPAFRRGRGTVYARITTPPGLARAASTVDVVLGDGRWLATLALPTGEVLVPDLPDGEAEILVRLDP